jgi:hypothetical protein
MVKHIRPSLPPLSLEVGFLQGYDGKLWFYRSHSGLRGYLPVGLGLVMVENQYI